MIDRWCYNNIIELTRQKDKIEKDICNNLGTYSQKPFNFATAEAILRRFTGDRYFVSIT